MAVSLSRTGVPLLLIPFFSASSRYAEIVQQMVDELIAAAKPSGSGYPCVKGLGSQVARAIMHCVRLGLKQSTHVLEGKGVAFA